MRRPRAWRDSTSPPLEARLQATLNVIPTHTWYATASGGLTFLNVLRDRMSIGDVIHEIRQFYKGQDRDRL